MFQKIAKHRANDASNDVHRPPLDWMETVSSVLASRRIGTGFYTLAPEKYTSTSTNVSTKVGG